MSLPEAILLLSKLRNDERRNLQQFSEMTSRSENTENCMFPAVYTQNRLRYAHPSTLTLTKGFARAQLPVPVAQWIARWTSNPKVPGSNPGRDVFL